MQKLLDGQQKSPNIDIPQHLAYIKKKDTRHCRETTYMPTLKQSIIANVLPSKIPYIFTRKDNSLADEPLQYLEHTFLHERTTVSPLRGLRARDEPEARLSKRPIYTNRSP